MRRSNLAVKEEEVFEPMTVSEELILIRDSNGGLISPRKVVDFARDPGSALHKRFEWDDSKAAEDYRLWQARKVIRLELVIIGKDEQGQTVIISGVESEDDGAGGQEVRAYVSLTSDRAGDDSGGYRSLVDVLSDESYRDQMLESAKTDMIIFKRKYQVLSQLSKVFAEMDKILK